MSGRIYISIDLKSFYASVECVALGLDPLAANLVVADESRTEKTICLAVSPSLKALGIPGRARLFEVVQKVREVNQRRKRKIGGREFTGKSHDGPSLLADPYLEVSYIVAPPRMAHYVECSAKIYQIYLRYIAPEDIHSYSIDEVFIDATDYLRIYDMTAEQLAGTMIRAVLKETGVTATGGIGTNLYLSKIALDIVSKHVEPDKDGVRLAFLDEMSYREKLWSHRPLTDFWRVGRGYARKLEERGLFTMGDIARCSLGGDQDYYNEDLLYKLFGVNAELLIDHAWGWEPCGISHIKAYKPQSRCISLGQVLQEPYPMALARVVVQEMADQAALELLEKRQVTDQIVLTLGYDKINLTDKDSRQKYQGEVVTDRYGRLIPKHGHGTENLEGHTSLASKIMAGAMRLFDRIADPDLLIRRITLVANHLIPEEEGAKKEEYHQMNLFSDYGLGNREREKEEEALRRERKMQEAVLELKKRFGKNAVVRGMSLQEGATAISRNKQIGGHKA